MTSQISESNSNPLVTGSHKRDAAAAGILQPVEDEKKQKTCSTTAETNVPRKKAGRPRGSLTTQKNPTKRLLHLRINRPVKTKIPIDVWDQIIRYSTLSSLLKMRNISKDFRALLSNASLWRAVRHNTYGPDHPDPPPGIDERQYADLLVGTGCQSKGCKNTRANWTYWAFQRRWCIPCLKKKTVPLEGCDFFLKFIPGAAECVPRINLCAYTIWKKGNQARSPSVIGFLRADIARIAGEFEEAAEELGATDRESHPGFRAWVDKKAKANDDFVGKLQLIEEWAIYNYANIREEAASRKEERSDFFAAKALLMDPPLELTALRKLSCFQNAISSKIQPSEKAWESLEKKIRAEQDGEECSVTELQEKYRGNCMSLQCDPDEIRIRKEQALTDVKRKTEDRMLTFADQVLADLVELPQSLLVPDDDFVRIALTRFYKLYQELKLPVMPCLTMNDARFVYNRKIQPVIAGLRGEERKTAVAQLRCPGCSYGNPPKQNSFEELMNHIWDEHAELAAGFNGFDGDSIELHLVKKQDREPFPWCYFRWPPTLPILASQQEVFRGRFDVMMSVPDLCVAASNVTNGPGAFDGRVAAQDMGPPASEFVENVRFAAFMFERTSIEDKYKTQLALEYAILKFGTFTSSRPSREMFKHLQRLLLWDGTSGLFEGFRCRICCETARLVGAVSYFARSIKPLAKLGEHFFDKHYPADWTRDMLNLPSTQELLTHLQLPCNQDAYSFFVDLFPLRGDMVLDPRLQGDAADDTAEETDFAEEQHSSDAESSSGEGDAVEEEDSEESEEAEVSMEEDSDDEEDSGEEDSRIGYNSRAEQIRQARKYMRNQRGRWSITL
ncbi:MAG: hypothetical protein Q9225_003129 [Loekoesia sp. 1 TL-2023]